MDIGTPATATHPSPPSRTDDARTPQARVLPSAVSDQQFAHGLLDVEGFVPVRVDTHPHPNWLAVARGLYTHGTGSDGRFIPRPGMDPQLALRHIGAVLQSPRLDEHQRDQAVAQLLADWFLVVVLESGPSAGPIR